MRHSSVTLSLSTLSMASETLALRWYGTDWVVRQQALLNCQYKVRPDNFGAFQNP